MPLVCLLALGENVRLGIVPSSHRVSHFADSKVYHEQEYSFSAGQAIIFHPLLMHYGCGYKDGEDNLRIHFYFDHTSFKRATEQRVFLATKDVLNTCHLKPSKVKRHQSRRGHNLESGGRSKKQKIEDEDKN